MTAEFTHELRAMLAELATARMPFGRFGPAKFPPQGLPVYELPYEYLAFFERKGYPRGRLGEQLKFVHDIKRDGAEQLFDPLRRATAGPASLRRRRAVRLGPAADETEE